MANKYGTNAYDSPTALLDANGLEAITLAVPTVDHRRLASEAIERGIHLLIEKPIAFTVEEGQAIISAAEEAGVILMIGHIERFNHIGCRHICRELPG